MFKRCAAVLATAAIGMAAALPSAAHAAVITFTATDSTVVTGRFNFDTATRAFSGVALQFDGTVTNSTDTLDNPFSFFLNSLGSEDVSVNVGSAVGVVSIFGGKVDIPGGTLTDPALNYAQSLDLKSLADGVPGVPAAGSQQVIDWSVGQLDGESFLLGTLNVDVKFNVTQVGTPPDQPNVVPEPATFGLVAGSVLLCAALTRRRRSDGDAPTA